MMTGTSGMIDFSSPRSAKPSIPGMRISLIIALGVAVLSAASKSSAQAKLLQEMSSPESAFSMTQRIELSSSTTQISFESVMQFFHWYQQCEAGITWLTNRLDNTAVAGECELCDG